MFKKMKKLLLLTLLCFSINGFGFNCKKVSESTDGDSYYVDNIKKHNGLFYYWELTDSLEPIKFEEDTANSYKGKY